MYTPIPIILIIIASVIDVISCQRLLNLADEEKWVPDMRKMETMTPKERNAWLVQWTEDVTERCEQNGIEVFVALEIKKVWKCLEKPNKPAEGLEYEALRELLFEDERGKNPSPSREEMCSHLNSSLECMTPSINKISSCFESEEFPKESLIKDMVYRYFQRMCEPDWNYENALGKYGDVLAECMKNHADEIILDTTECFDERTVKTKGILVEGSRAVCKDMETYQNCWVDALEICDNEGAEKLLYRMLHNPSYSSIVLKNIYKCQEYDDEEAVKTNNKDEL